MHPYGSGRGRPALSSAAAAVGELCRDAGQGVGGGGAGRAPRARSGGVASRAARGSRLEGVSTARLKILGNEIMIKNVGKSQSCMVSKLPIIFKRTRS